MDKPTQSRIAKLHPSVRTEAITIIQECDKALTGRAKVRITQGLRTFKEQEELYALGRTISVSGADNLAIADAKTVNKKLQGTTSKKSTTEETNTVNAPSTNSISTSQQSYDRLIDHFANLIQVVEQNTNYTPNETELQVASLQTKLTELQTKNTNLINTYTGYSNAMIERNQTLYNPLTGLVQTSKEVKQYVKSVFGANSPQYKQVSGLEFKVIKKD